MQEIKRQRHTPLIMATAIPQSKPQLQPMSINDKTRTTTSSNPRAKSPSKSNSKPKSNLLIHFLAGGTSAGLVRAFLQPLDTCKTRLQAHVSTGTKMSLQTLQKILFRDLGIRGLYRGVIPGVMGIVPAAAVYMLVYQTMKKVLHVNRTNNGDTNASREHNKAKTLKIMLSAAIGDTIASVVRVPCEVLKQRLQVGVYGSTSQALSMLSSPSSLPLLYAGLSAQLARDIPFAAVEFASYEYLKTWASRKGWLAESGTSSGGNSPAASKIQGLLVGGMSGALAAIVSNPMDVVKTRLMTQLRESQGSALSTTASAHIAVHSATVTTTTASASAIARASSSASAAAVSPMFASNLRIVANPAISSPSHMNNFVKTTTSSMSSKSPQFYRGVRHCFVSILQNEGIQAFGKGLVPRIATKTLQSALFFATYEAMYRLYSKMLKVKAEDEHGSILAH